MTTKEQRPVVVVGHAGQEAVLRAIQAAIDAKPEIVRTQISVLHPSVVPGSDR